MIIRFSQHQITLSAHRKVINGGGSIMSKFAEAIASIHSALSEESAEQEGVSAVSTSTPEELQQLKPVPIPDEAKPEVPDIARATHQPELLRVMLPGNPMQSVVAILRDVAGEVWNDIKELARHEPEEERVLLQQNLIESFEEVLDEARANLDKIAQSMPHFNEWGDYVRAHSVMTQKYIESLLAEIVGKEREEPTQLLRALADFRFDLGEQLTAIEERNTEIVRSQLAQHLPSEPPGQYL